MQEPKQKSIEPVLKQLGMKSCLGSELAKQQITGVAYDSRQVKPGNAFVSIAGGKLDGNSFIGEAIRNGASFILSEREPNDCSVPFLKVADARLALALLADYYFDHPSFKLRLIGVTGTNGKTTTTHLVEHILNSAGRKTGLIGTLGARWPGQASYQDVKHTTPESADLHQIIALMADASCSHVSMEVSSHALAQKRVAGCQFAVGCLTNITQDHLDFHQTMEQYWHSKRLLFADLNASSRTNKTAVINQDDPLASEFLKSIDTSVNKLTYSWQGKSDLYVKRAHFDFAGTSLLLNTPYGEADLKLKMTGRFNIYNVMAALLICLAEGVDLIDCGNALSNFSGVSGRFEVVSFQSGLEPLVIVDYAHTPDGLDNVLKAAKNIVPDGGKLIAVFGCGGDRDSSKRPQMGGIAELLSDQVIVTSDNPRSEDPEQIIADILTGIKRIKSVYVEPDRASAISWAVSQATDLDVIVVAGKGHEDYQILADRTIPFDDRKQVEIGLKERAQMRQPK